MNDIISNEWMEKYELAKKYYEERGNLLILQNYFLIINNKKVNLGTWIKYQRVLYKEGKLNEKQIELLNKIGMVWQTNILRSNDDQSSYKWKRNYELAKEYYEKNGDLLIPHNYFLIIDNKKMNLGTWIVTQRQAYKNNKLNEKQIELLNKIGMIWQTNILKSNNDEISYKWKRNYELAKEYYEKHGNLLISANYEIIGENNEVVKLGDWINTQRRAYKNRASDSHRINEEQIRLLNNIGMVWQFKSERENIRIEYISNIWIEKYDLAKTYYEEHGNLLIPYDFCLTTSNKKINLGDWIHTQRKSYKNGTLKEEQIKMLNRIDMIWDLKKHKKYLQKIKEKILLDNLTNYERKSVDEFFNNELIEYKDDDTIKNTIRMIKKSIVINNK